jgi:hypothetical protein
MKGWRLAAGRKNKTGCFQRKEVLDEGQDGAWPVSRRADAREINVTFSELELRHFLMYVSTGI